MVIPAAVGVDNGGTWIRLKAINAKGRVLWSLKKPSPTVDQLPVFLARHLKQFHGNLSGLAVGSRGAWKPAKRRALQQALRKLAKQVVVMSDVEAAWQAAFKTEGILLISGTGSIAYGRKRNGTSARAGGLGPPKGDEGSGFWIGKEWLIRSGRAGERAKRWDVRRTATLTPSVIRKAKQGDPLARDIVRDAHGHLVRLVADIQRTLKLKNNVPLSVGGSLLINVGFRRGFLSELRRQRIRIRYMRARFDVPSALAHSFLPLSRSAARSEV